MAVTDSHQRSSARSSFTTSSPLPHSASPPRMPGKRTLLSAVLCYCCGPTLRLHLGRTWAQRILTLSKAVPITIVMNDPHPCEASVRPFFWAHPPKPGPPKLDPHKVLVEHLFHIRELELGACSCTVRRWNAFLSSWALGSLPLAQLASLTITALDPRNTMDPTAPVTPTREQLLECLLLMPALQELHLKHCLPTSPRSRRALCYQVLSQVDIPPAARVKVPRAAQAVRTLSRSPLSLLSAWHAFARLTPSEDRERYYGPKGDPDVRLECDWDAGDPLRATAAAVWSAGDWYNTFVNCPEIAHVLAYDTLAESLLNALGPSSGIGNDTGVDIDDYDNNGGDDDDSDSDNNGDNDNDSNNNENDDNDIAPLFQELPVASLTLVGIDFIEPLMRDYAGRIELRACTIEDDEVDCLKEFASVIMILVEEGDEDDEDIGVGLVSSDGLHPQRK
ncbi:hypothetical protein EDB83DRAFT_2553537 [Lactarius deliciosus]|nr:hypothetical protein EDB83DRAFT_2553537 [Lactarius deliciosus]